MKVLLFANTDWYLYNFRFDFAVSLKNAGYEVVLLSPDGPYRSKIEAMGFRWLEVPISRRGVNPLSEVKNIFHLYGIYKKEKPDFVHHFTIKCVFYGSTVAHLLGIKRIINSITGLGYVFIGSSFKVRLLRRLSIVWYKLILQNSRVIFQNSDDMAFFIQEGMVKKDECILIAGSGVNVDLFSYIETEKRNIPLVVLASRMLYDKGIVEYVAAAKKLKKDGVPGRFILVGTVDEGNPTAINGKQLNQWQEEGFVEWWGWRDNMADIYHQADIACLPSYREGLPKMLIEAGACGLPLVTTDIPGCREVVTDGENGLLVPLKDAESLAAALRRLLLDKGLRHQMGQRSREIVEKQFSLKTVIDKTLRVYESMSKMEP